MSQKSPDVLKTGGEGRECYLGDLKRTLFEGLIYVFFGIKLRLLTDFRKVHKTF